MNSVVLSETASTSIPEIGFVRLGQILSVLPIGRSSWWNGVKEGRYPKPLKLGPATTVWKAEEIRELLERIAQPHTPKLVKNSRAISTHKNAANAS